MYYLIAYGIWNIVVFLIYGLDKYRAVKRKRRIKENHLIILAYLGGGIGAFIGMLIFRHKIRKMKFQLLVSFALILNLVTVYYLILKDFIVL